MKKLVIPLILIFLSGAVCVLSTLAIKDVGAGFFHAPQSIDWSDRFPHYMRIRRLMPSRWLSYTSLYEQCFLNNQKTIKRTDEESIIQTKIAIKLSYMTGQMTQYLESRRQEALLVIILTVFWIVGIFRKEKRKFAEQGRSG